MSGYKPLRSGISTSKEGTANGVATLDGDGLLAQSAFDVDNLYSTSDTLGRYYSFNVGPMATVIPSEGFLHLVPWLLHAPMPVDRIAAYVTVVGTAGAVLRLGAFRHIGGAGGWELLFDAGTVAAETTGTREITIDQTLPRGLVALGLVAQGGAGTRPTVRSVTPYRLPLIGFRDSDVGNAGAIKLQTSVSGAFASAYQAVNYSAASPIVAVRVKA